MPKEYINILNDNFSFISNINSPLLGFETILNSIKKCPDFLILVEKIDSEYNLNIFSNDSFKEKIINNKYWLNISNLFKQWCCNEKLKTHIKNIWLEHDFNDYTGKINPNPSIFVGSNLDVFNLTVDILGENNNKQKLKSYCNTLINKLPSGITPGSMGVMFSRKKESLKVCCKIDNILNHSEILEINSLLYKFKEVIYYLDQFEYLNLANVLTFDINENGILKTCMEISLGDFFEMNSIKKISNQNIKLHKEKLKNICSAFDKASLVDSNVVKSLLMWPEVVVLDKNVFVKCISHIKLVDQGNEKLVKAYYGIRHCL